MGLYSCFYSPNYHAIEIQEYIPGAGSAKSESIVRIRLRESDMNNFDSTYRVARQDFDKAEEEKQKTALKSKRERRDRLKLELEALNKELGET